MFASKLSSWTEKCVISFIDEYPFLRAVFDEFGIKELDKTQINALAQKMAQIIKQCAPAMCIMSCCEKDNLEQYGITFRLYATFLQPE